MTVDSYPEVRTPPELATELAWAPDPIIVGHRGSGRTRRRHPWTENTLRSFERAFEEGADMVELDIQLTSDGELVVYHDPRVPRRQLGREPLSHLDLRQLSLLKLRGGETVPTLTQVFQAFLPRRPEGLVFDVELKKQKQVPEEAVISRLKAVIESCEALHRCIFTSFDLELLRYLKDALPEAWCMWLVTRFKPGIQRLLRERARGFRLEGLVVKHHRSPLDLPYIPSIFTGRLTRLAQLEGILLGAYTVNRPFQLLRMKQLGVRFIITDRPALAVELFRSAPADSDAPER